MNLKLEGKYKSLNNFEWNNIPDFVVLTGENGAGKTQLLDLLSNLHNSQGSVSDEEFNNATVTLSDTDIELGRNQIGLVLFRIGGDLESYYDLTVITKNIREFTSRYDSYKNQKFYSPNAEDRFTKVLNFIENKSGKSKFELTTEEIETFYPLNFDFMNDSFLSTGLGEYFFKYNHRRMMNQFNRYLSNFSGERVPNYYITDEEFIELWGEAPWDRLNKLLTESNLPYEFTYPSTNDITQSFMLRLISKSNNRPIESKHLSEGERVILSVVVAMFNSFNDVYMPKLLLLDEPDSHLHPSMCKKMLEILIDVFCKTHGVKIIMTTHSPSTVALAPEESIFLITRDGNPRIRQADKREAIKLLTNGFVTVAKTVKTVLVEDKDDKDFYTGLYISLVTENIIGRDVMYEFKSSKVAREAGGRNEVMKMVEISNNLGFELYGLVDRDREAPQKERVFSCQRYSIENYLLDPLNVYAVLMEHHANPKIRTFDIAFGDEYKFKVWSNDKLQAIADTIFNTVENILENLTEEEKQKVPCSYVNGSEINIPNWLINKPGKDILKQLAIKKNWGDKVNFKNLMKMFHRLRIIPQEIADNLKSI